MTQQFTYDPEHWLESATRAIKEYAENNLDETYKVIMEFPSSDTLNELVPLEKTIIHFEIDAIEDRLLGLGESFIFTYDATAHTTLQQSVGIHLINFDVGVWASAKSGGSTSRLRAKQALTEMFQGKQAQDNLDAAASTGDGRIEILNYTGGRFLTDRINDVDVYRMIDCSMDVRVFSRTPTPPAVSAPALEEILQNELEVTS